MIRARHRRTDSAVPVAVVNAASPNSRSSSKRCGDWSMPVHEGIPCIAIALDMQEHPYVSG